MGVLNEERAAASASGQGRVLATRRGMRMMGVASGSARGVQHWALSAPYKYL